MAKIYGQLERAQLENVTVDPAGGGLSTGRTWMRTDLSQAKIYDGTGARTFLLGGIGQIVNADVNASAAIAYSKLSLSNSIVNADVNSSAAIAGTKITPSFGSQNITTTGTSTLKELATVSGSDYSTTGTSNNVSTASLSLFRYTGAGTATITGFANGSDGKILRFINASSSKVTINDQDGSSTAANRITTGVGAALVLLPGGALNLVYDATASLWRVVGAPGANGGWTAYTPTLSGFGTTSNVSFFYRRNGQNIQVRGSFTAGTTAATAAQMTFPAGFTPDTTFITGTFPTVGWGISPQTNTMLALYYGDATHANFINNASQTNGSQVATSATSISVMLEYPVQ